MRRSFILGGGAVALIVAGTAFLPGTARAGEVLTVQYYGAPRDEGPPDWERRRAWREQRDEARIAEAARQEAERIEQERAERRAWRRERREQREALPYGYGVSPDTKP